MWRRSLLASLVLGTAVVCAQSPDADRLADLISANQSALKDARSQNNEIDAVLHEDDAQATAIRNRLAGGSRDLVRIHRDLDRANDELNTARTALDPLKARFDAAQDQLNAARQTARKKLEDNSEFRSVAGAVQRATDECREAEDASARTLERTALYQNLQSAVDAANTRADYFHRAGPAFVRDEADAKERLHNAIARRDAAKEQFLKSDPAVQRQRTSLASANGRLDALKADIEKRIDALPEVAAVQHALDAERVPFNAASARVESARARVAMIQNALVATESGMAEDRNTLQAINDEMAEARADRARISADIDRIGSDLADEVAAANQIQRQASAASTQTSNAIGPTSWTVPGGFIPIPSVPPTFTAPSSGEPPPAAWANAPIYATPGYLGVGGWYGSRHGFHGRHDGGGPFGQVPNFGATTSNIPTGEWVGHPQAWGGTIGATPHGRSAGSSAGVGLPQGGVSVQTQAPAGAFPQIIGVGRPSQGMTFVAPHNPTAGAYPRFGVPAPQAGNAEPAGGFDGPGAVRATHSAGHR